MIDVIVQSIYWQVDGLRMSLLYTEGGFEEDVTIQVTDGVSWAGTTLHVNVAEVNDAPVIEEVPVIYVDEDEEALVDLAPYIWDEELEDGELLLVCDHPNVVRVEGLELTLLFDMWQQNLQIGFSVTDGQLTVQGQFPVSIKAVNDHPVIRRLGVQEPPFRVVAVEGTTLFLPMVAEDEDDSALWFSVESSWVGLYVEGARLYIEAGEGDAGDHEGRVIVHDHRGGSGGAMLTVTVLGRDDLGVSVGIVSPFDQQTYRRDEPILFQVEVRDPKDYLLSPATVTWWSDQMGELRSGSGPDSTSFEADDLPEGRHVITVVVTDGVLTFEDEVVVQVGEGPGGDADDVLGGAIGVFIGVIVLTMLIVVAMVIVSSHANRPTKDRMERVFALIEKESELTPEKAASMRGEEMREGRIMAEREREERHKRTAEARYSEEVSSTVSSRAEAERAGRARRAREAAERPRAAEARPKPVPTRAPGRPLPSEEELMIQIETFKRALEALPGGLPGELELYDVSTIANRIAKGRKKWTADGRLAAFIQGTWYYADPSDPEFMERLVE
jgi:hypothetical protein